MAAAVGGCLHDDGPPGHLGERIALSQAQQRWQASGIASYDYYLRKTCFCPGGELGGGREVLISIRNDVIERITYADTGEDVPASQYEFYATVPDLFETIRQGIASADVIQVEYDPAFGYPYFIFIDYYRGAADDEISYDARDLTAI